MNSHEAELGLHGERFLLLAQAHVQYLLGGYRFSIGDTNEGYLQEALPILPYPSYLC